MAGMPAKSESLTLTGVDARWRCGALVSELPPADGVNVPLSRMPFAWAGRKPGCDPFRLSNACRALRLKTFDGSSLAGVILRLFLLAFQDETAMLGRASRDGVFSDYHDGVILRGANTGESSSRSGLVSYGCAGPWLLISLSSTIPTCKPSSPITGSGPFPKIVFRSSAVS